MSILNIVYYRDDFHDKRFDRTKYESEFGSLGNQDWHKHPIDNGEVHVWYNVNWLDIDVDFYSGGTKEENKQKYMKIGLKWTHEEQNDYTVFDGMQLLNLERMEQLIGVITAKLNKNSNKSFIIKL